MRSRARGIRVRLQIREACVGVHLCGTPQWICECVCVHACACGTICYIIQLTQSSSCTKWTSFCRISSSTLRRQREEEKKTSIIILGTICMAHSLPAPYLPLMLKFFPSIRCLREGCLENAGMTASKSASKPAHTRTRQWSTCATEAIQRSTEPFEKTCLQESV